LQQLLQLAWASHNNSVAFDAQKRSGKSAGYDTPTVLSDYATFHHADPKIWTFATGDEKGVDSLTRAFSVYRQTEGGTISHGLATALINRDGRIERIWRGNAWTPAEVTQAVQAESK